MLPSIVQLIAELAVFFALCLGAVVIHEAGHVLVGVSCGFKIVGVRVGPVRWDWSQGTAFRLDHVHRADGAVNAQFRQFPREYAICQVALFLLGGSFANFAFAALSITVWNTRVGGFFALFAAVSILVGFLGLLPLKTKMGLSDGAKLFRIIFSKRMRRTTIDRFSILPRINEVSRLCRKEQFAEAYPKLEELIALLQSIATSPANLEYPNKLIHLKEQIAQKLNQDSSLPVTSSPQTSESV